MYNRDWMYFIIFTKAPGFIVIYICMSCKIVPSALPYILENHKKDCIKNKRKQTFSPTFTYKDWDIFSALVFRVPELVDLKTK